MNETFGKAISKVLNRLTITVALILLQVGWFVMLFFRLVEHTSWITLIMTLLSAIVALYVIYKDDNPAYKIGWILFIGLVPLLGAPMYLLFGNKRTSKNLKRKIESQEELHREDFCQVQNLDEILSPRLAGTAHYISECGPYPAWTGTKTKYYSLGDYAFADMIEDIKQAKHFIFLEYFIVEEGKMWGELFSILQQKVDEGVDVRMMYDDIGSISKVPMSFYLKVKQSGIKVMAFNPLTPIVSLIYNNRDHRKMLIIDGNIGYSGGYNLADEYINEAERFGHWKDSGIRLEGEGVWNYTLMFLNMWNAFIKTDKSYEKFRPNALNDRTFENDGVVQPYSDSPLDNENIGENVYLEILNQAEKYVYIFTPYLVIDNEMKTALVLAAKRGVDVRIVTPGIPDKKMVFRLTRSYYAPLIEAGVRIYEYTPGFIHSKSYLCDDKIGVVGTINMDYRSLYLHFECGTLLIDCEALKDLKKDCLDTFKVSREIQYEDCHRGFFGILLDAILRVISPLL